MFDEDDDYDNDGLDEILTAEEPVTPPENLRLTVEVGLTEYSPDGLLALVARGLLQQIGGRDKWSSRLEQMLLTMGKKRAEELVTEVVENTFSTEVAGLDFPAIVRKAAEEYMKEPVNSEGKASGYTRDSSRLQWLVSRLTKEAMDAAFKEAEKEWRAATQNAIKETLTEALSSRLAKSLPAPPEVRG